MIDIGRADENRAAVPRLGGAPVADHAAIHVAGERMFVDYAGATLVVIDASIGEARTTQLFVAVLGASNYTYAEAGWTQGLSDWIGSHTRSFAVFGGVPATVVSDYVPGRRNGLRHKFL